MMIIAYYRFNPGVTLDFVTPCQSEEEANVWRQGDAGVVRGIYTRADATHGRTIWAA
jgi:hypothetical protein